MSRMVVQRYKTKLRNYVDIRRNNVTMPHTSTLSHYHIPVEVLRAAVKVTVNTLPASCQLFHRKTYGNIYIHCAFITKAVTFISSIHCHKRNAVADKYLLQIDHRRRKREGGGAGGQAPQ